MWPTLRDFLSVPDELTGKGVRIAVVDGDFPSHPDITTNEQRTTYKVMVMESEPQPKVFEAEPGPWRGGAHGLWAAAAAAGSGAESQGLYRGIAPEADLFLVAEYFPGQSQILKDDMRHILRHWNGFGTIGASTRYELYCQQKNLGLTQAFYLGKRSRHVSCVKK